MTTATTVVQRGDAEQPRRQSRDVGVRQRVLLALGEPTDLVRVQVRELWDRRYRVNVYVGTDVISARVAHSYFLETDADGTIITSTPKIDRRYGRPADQPRPFLAAGAVTGV
jgi:hypothetical protein